VVHVDPAQLLPRCTSSRRTDGDDPAGPPAACRRREHLGNIGLTDRRTRTTRHIRVCQESLKLFQEQMHAITVLVCVCQ